LTRFGFESDDRLWLCPLFRLALFRLNEFDVLMCDELDDFGVEENWANGLKNSSCKFRSLVSINPTIRKFLSLRFK
jgi:hypothetical protein